MELKSPEWQQWARDPQTRAFLDLLRETVLTAQEAWLNRELEDDNPHRWLTLNAAALASAGLALEWIEAIENAGE